MEFALGIVLFAVGILVAVALHEAGHMWSARAFGMKVTRFFIGFGPTIFAFSRKGVEYGLKALPFGAFVKITGMTQQEEDLDPETGKPAAEHPRAMWRYPVWKRTIVMSAGSITHFALALVTLWVLFSFVGVPDTSKINDLPVRVGAVSECISPKYEFDPKTGTQKACDPATDPKSPAAQLGLQPGDIIVAVDGQAIGGNQQLRDVLKGAVDKTVEVRYKRGDQVLSGRATIPAAERPKPGKPANEIGPADLERGGLLGINVDLRYSDLPTHTYGPVDGVGQTFIVTGNLVERTFASFKDIPEKIPNLLKAILGEQRDPETPVSVVGASRIGGELFELGDWASLLSLFATLNLFFGIFNLFPLLPMDGGHIAIAWYERVRSWIAAKRGRPDPGRVDYYKLAPITLAVIGVLGVFVLLTVTADFVNPITLK
ncbi:site-2 protease family protein [Dactylosporangium roseum]|uniref:Site-2 protease family protein n=1 Tax=Dactylosporangium roseum TaxID=47989 RepID=A0ABY5ZB44_9ACTN|nr:M50 family metallopeptidase [Dactylosporangium roseum]UWZ38218.1 site-2 protease family protein [Dactylosporangium roseum]